MSTRKLINDPIYGFIQYPYTIIYDIIAHPYFQRLRRISQMGFSNMVYPGAMHTRFHHTLGAVHLMQAAIQSLRSKGVEITEEEAEAACIAILLHDIGHGPFSHALEGEIIGLSHETLSIEYMKELAEIFGAPVHLALTIFKNEHPKLYLHQLVSSQLDMDRLDYLSRDSYYTGVVEGMIGYDRIIQMLQVHNNSLVVEEKGIHSIEKFLVARRIMYWQVYLHKTAVGAECVLTKIIRLIKKELRTDKKSFLYELLPKGLCYFFSHDISIEEFRKNRSNFLKLFSSVDEHDIFFILKKLSEQGKPILSYLSSCLLNRNLFKVVVQKKAFTKAHVQNVRDTLLNVKELNMLPVDDVILIKEESNISYSTKKESIKILTKDNKVYPITKYSENLIDTKLINRYFLCFPKIYS